MMSGKVNMSALKISLKEALIDSFWSLWIITMLLLMAVWPVFGIYHLNWTISMTWGQVGNYSLTGALMSAIFIAVNPFKQPKKDNN